MRGQSVRLSAAVVGLILASTAPSGMAAGVKARTFDFTYDATVTGVAPGTPVRIWAPLAPTDEDQVVECLTKPADGRVGVETTYGNRVLYLEKSADSAGTVPLTITYRVTRYEDCGDRAPLNAQSADASKFLRADARVPVGGKGMRLLQGKNIPKDQTALAHLLYNVVDDHMTYRKDKPGWGFGDSDWACDSQFGNCTDFHSLFISLARGEGIPAKFEIGFMIGPPDGGKVGGYHCWAKFKPEGKGWMPVDISEANQHPEERAANFGMITSNRIMFSTGRDLTLVPPQANGPVNFFVYPYVEVSGQVWPQEKIEKRFSYKDAGDAVARRAAAN